MKHTRFLLSTATAVSITLVGLVTVPSAKGAERVTLNEVGGFDTDHKPQTVQVSANTRVKAVTIVHGDRINQLILHGADNKDVSFGGEKGAKGKKLITLNDGEYLVGFRGLCSNGDDYMGISMRGGWFKVQAVIASSNGNKRYSEEVGTGGPSNMRIAGDVKVTVGMKRFEVLAPEGHEVVGVVGKGGAVIDSVRLITQKR